jgi:hypothetical protein
MAFFKAMAGPRIKTSDIHRSYWREIVIGARASVAFRRPGLSTALPGVTGGIFSSPVFSLQLNPQPFSTSVSNGAKDPSVCQGWQQFLNSSESGIPMFPDSAFPQFDFGVAFMQYWLLGFGNPCPSGWDERLL